MKLIESKVDGFRCIQCKKIQKPTYSAKTENETSTIDQPGDCDCGSKLYDIIITQIFRLDESIEKLGSKLKIVIPDDEGE